MSTFRPSLAASDAAEPARPARFAGFPLSAWAFGLRIWIAMMAALYAAFWLQLESASSAAVCVGILALPTRGQAYQKAFYRMAGTLVGGLAALVIAGLFAQSRDLYILAFAGWMALCVYAASLLDGNRAYGAVLSGYTVAIIAVANIDTPQEIFVAAINRGAAITIGVAALLLFNDLLAAPDVFPGLLSRMEGVHRKVVAFACAVLTGNDPDPGEVAGLLKAVTTLHADITALPIESIAGKARAAAARMAVAAMVREVSAARSAGIVLATLGEAGRAQAAALADALDDSDGPQALATARRIDAALDGGHAADASFIAASAARVLLDQNRATFEALQAMRTGRGPLRGPALPLFRLREAALRNAARIFIAIALGALLFVVSGWPETSFALTLLGATAGLSATNPNPRQFAAGAIRAMPIAAVLAGVVEFLILDGVDAFPLLALAMAPVIIGAGLMLGSGKPALQPIGFLVMVFFPVLISPTNPQTYNPETFLFTSMLAIVAVIALFIVLNVVLPTSDARKRAWILRSIRRDLARALDGAPPRLTIGGAAFRDADRIGQLGDLRAEGVEDRAADLSHGLHLAALTSAAWRARLALIDDALPPDAERDGCKALASCDPAALRHVADGLLGPTPAGAATADHEVAARRWAAATLSFMAVLIDRRPADVADLAGEGAR